MSAHRESVQPYSARHDATVRHRCYHPGSVGAPWRDGRMHRASPASRPRWCHAVMPGGAQLRYSLMIHAEDTYRVMGNEKCAAGEGLGVRTRESAG